MITPELVKYIKEQLAGGTPEGVLKDKLVANGWKSADVDEGFRAVKPAPVVTTPVQPIAPVQQQRPITPGQQPVQTSPAQVTSQPAQTASPAAASPLAAMFSKPAEPARSPVQSTPVQVTAPVTTPIITQPIKQTPIQTPVQPQSTTKFSISTDTQSPVSAMQPVGTPTESVHIEPASIILLMAGIIGILVGTFLSVFGFSKILASLGGVSTSLGIIAVVFLVVSLIQVALIQGFTKLFKMPLASWKRAFFVVGIPTALSGIASLSSAFGSSALPLILGLIVIVIWFVMFMKTYKSGFGKALGVGLLTMVITAIIVVVIGFALGLGALFKLGKEMPGGGSTWHPEGGQPSVYVEEPENDVIFEDNVTIGASCEGREPAIDITSPLAGTFRVDEDMNITWKSCNIPSDEEVLISMVRPDGSDFAVYVGPNSGRATLAPVYAGSFKLRASDNNSDGGITFMDTTASPITVQ